MIRFPFLGYYYPYHYYPPHSLSSISKKDIIKNETSIKKDTNYQCTQKKTPSKNNLISFHFEGFSNPNKVILEVLGIKLYLDDLIILGLLYILYQEGIKDEMLFICLFLLLLS